MHGGEDALADISHQTKPALQAQHQDRPKIRSGVTHSNIHSLRERLKSILSSQYLYYHHFTCKNRQLRLIMTLEIISVLVRSVRFNLENKKRSP